MFRYRQLVACVIVAFSVCCGGQEQGAIDTFLGAVRSNDEAARSAVSSVGFSEEVDSWEIVDLGTESTEPFRLPELRRKAQDAKRDLDLHVERSAYFVRDNDRIYKQYQARIEENPDYPFKGELAEFRERWQEILLEEKDLESKVEEANAEMQRERGTATVSLMGSSVTEALEGEVSVREATVHVKDRQGGERPYRFTLRKYNLINTINNAEPRSRWIVTQIQEQGG